MSTAKINATPANRKALRSHAREAMMDYSRIMTWLIVDQAGGLYEIVVPQGQTSYIGSDEVIATTGGFHKAHGAGAAADEYGKKYRTQKAYLTDLLGAAEYKRIFG